MFKLISARIVDVPVNISWGNEAKTYTVFEFEGKWTWSEYFTARSQGIKMVMSVPQIVNLIVDYRNSAFFPENMLSNFGSSLQKVPKDFDLAVIVTRSSFVIAIVNMISRLSFKSNVKFKVVKTMEEAHALMAKYDASPQSIDVTRPRR
jgi:hypothetical protein